MKKLLKVLEVNQQTWNSIFKLFGRHIKEVDDLYPYYKGYQNKANIYWHGQELICREYLIDYLTGGIDQCTDWKQCRVRLNASAANSFEDSLSGTRAKAYFKKILKDFYSDKEIDACLKAHEADYCEADIQMHYFYPAPDNKIISIDNCTYYDINGAHLDALCEIFPKAKDRLIKMYKDRSKKAIFKKYPNFFVGMLAHKTEENRKLQLKARADGMRNTPYDAKYEKTYNWIVQRTTKLLRAAIKETNGALAYANTDGFIVYNNDNSLKTSKLLGDFKQEWQGILYIYKDKNYILYQMDEDLKGSMLLDVRNKVDLRAGKVIHYDIRRDKNSCVYAENIVEETVCQK